MGTAKRLRTDDVAGGGTPQPLVGGVSRATDVTRANMGAGDVRYDSARTTVITLQAPTAADSFKLGAYAQGADGDFARTDTAALVIGTNCAASDLQSELRTATGDSSLTVTGTTDVGPFTVTHALKGQPQLVAHTLSGMSVSIAPGTLAYDDPGTQSSSLYNGIVFDPESSKGFQATVPLGYAIETDGTGQAAGTELAPPTVVSAVGGSGQVVIDTTEVASGGTSAVVLTALRKLEAPAGSWATEWVTVDNEDADGDQTIASLSAGNYVALFHTQTANGRVSRPAAPVYFTVA